jgi:hypothetical protein
VETRHVSDLDLAFGGFVACPRNRGSGDVLGLGDLLARQGINVVMFNPRGMHASEGTFSFAHTVEDIGAALRWVDLDLGGRHWGTHSRVAA